AKKIMVTWGGYDPQETIPREPLAPGPPVLAHIGMLYGGRTPVALLRALETMSDAQRITSQDLRIEFLGATEFGSVEAVAQKLEAQGLIRIRKTPMSRSNALREASRVHYSLLIDIAPGNLTLQVPAKLFDQIRLGRPILAITPPGSPS